MLDLVNRRLLYFVLSLAVLVPGLISLLIPPGLKLGVEFTSGSAMTIRFDQRVEQAQLLSSLKGMGHPEAIVQRTGDSFFVRLRDIGQEEGEKERIEQGLREQLGGLTVLDFYAVSPIIAKEMARNAAIAVAGASVGILLYVAWAFRRLMRPWRYGICGVVALVHDSLVVLGSFSVLGRLFNVQVDAMFIVGILAVIGYSINDTVVVYDRIRENYIRGISREYATVVNESLVQTLGRSLNTSLTTLFAIFALFLLGGETIRYFVLVFLIGITAGTYSSIFIASQLLVVWETRRWGKLRPAGA